MKSYEKIKFSLNSDKIFDARKNFFNLGIFWVTFLILSCSSIVFFIFIFNSSDLVFDPTYAGVNNLVEIYKVPLALLALNIPFIAILGAFHKSEQTRLQIKLSEGQNLFANHYKRLEEFTKHIERFEHPDKRFKCEAKKIYRFLYPESSWGNYDLSAEASDFVDKMIKDASYFFYTPKINISGWFDDWCKVYLELQPRMNQKIYDRLQCKYNSDIVDGNLLDNEFPAFCFEKVEDNISYWATVFFFNLNAYNFLKHILLFDDNFNFSSGKNFIIDSVEPDVFIEQLKKICTLAVNECELKVSFEDLKPIQKFNSSFKNAIGFSIYLG